MKPTHGNPPETNGPFMVEFRSGVVAGPFTRGQLRWTDTGDSFDVVAVELAAKDAQQATWNAKAGGY